MLNAAFCPEEPGLRTWAAGSVVPLWEEDGRRRGVCRGGVRGASRPGRVSSPSSPSSLQLLCQQTPSVITKNCRSPTDDPATSETFPDTFQGGPKGWLAASPLIDAPGISVRNLTLDYQRDSGGVPSRLLLIHLTEYSSLSEPCVSSSAGQTLPFPH